MESIRTSIPIKKKVVALAIAVVVYLLLVEGSFSVKAL
nr:MAG TPA: hypothetical protein [Caudoviricetes sp.]